METLGSLEKAIVNRSFGYERPSNIEKAQQKALKLIDRAIREYGSTIPVREEWHYQCNKALFHWPHSFSDQRSKQYPKYLFVIPDLIVEREAWFE